MRARGRVIRAAMLAACTMGGGTSAAAEGGVASRLASLMAETSGPPRIMASAWPAVFPVPPVASRGDIPVAPRPVSYDADFLARQPTASGGAEWECLAEAIYFEARGESPRGQFAVGEVILNRVDSAAYPDSICGVVNQGCQFTYTCDDQSKAIAERAAWRQAGKIARLLIEGLPRELTAGATHYHTKAVSPSWSRSFPRTATIGYHHFYREPLRTAMQ